MEIILDFGSGNTCQNDWLYAGRMIKALASVDNHAHKIVIKWQLFENEGKNLALDHAVFKKALFLAGVLGYQTTASVFDSESLAYLLGFPIPFVKLANRRDLDYLVGQVPRGIPVYRSISDPSESLGNCVPLLCVSKYPAEIGDYMRFSGLRIGLSDHTVGTDLVKTFRPDIWEKHFVLEHAPASNPDGGFFAITPGELKELLREI